MCRQRILKSICVKLHRLVLKVVGIVLPNHLLVLHDHVLLIWPPIVVVTKILVPHIHLLLKGRRCDGWSVFDIWSTAALGFQVTVFLLVNGRSSLVKHHKVAICGGWNLPIHHVTLREPVTRGQR